MCQFDLGMRDMVLSNAALDSDTRLSLRALSLSLVSLFHVTLLLRSFAYGRRDSFALARCQAARSSSAPRAFKRQAPFFSGRSGLPKLRRVEPILSEVPYFVQ